jgi:hypothetical protein
LNNEAIGWDNANEWFEFSAALADVIEKLVAENKLKDKTDYALVWQAIGNGLKDFK